LKYSIIIPVFNRPLELEELLASLSQQTFQEFEVIVVEDGSEITSSEVVKDFTGELTLQYLTKENTGPGLSRNYGIEYAKTDYFIFLDSDTILPKNYLEGIEKSRSSNDADAFGGPDKAHDSFSLVQKAINYSMTSFLLTGGIRGRGRSLDRFYPRSFNMGFSREVFNATGGFSNMRFGEDIDLSIRIFENGFKTALFENAFVYHKRRTNFLKFFKQVYKSGVARINLQKRHPGSLKVVHALPLTATSGLIFLIVLSFTNSNMFLIPILVYFVLVFMNATIINRNPAVGFLSIISSFVQVTAYGTGFFIGLLRWMGKK